MTEVSLRIPAPGHGDRHTDREDVFDAVIEMARVPAVGEEIDYDGIIYKVHAVTFYTDGSIPYVYAR